MFKVYNFFKKFTSKILNRKKSKCEKSVSLESFYFGQDESCYILLEETKRKSEKEINLFTYCFSSSDGVIVEPSRPVGPLEVYDITRTSLKLRWQAPEDDGGGSIIAYVIEAKDVLLADVIKSYFRVDGSETECVLMELNPAHIYQFRVCAENEAGRGEALVNKKVFKLKKAARKPSIPSQPIVQLLETGTDDHHVSLSWSIKDGQPRDQDSGLTYIVERYDSNKDRWIQVNRVEVSTESYTVAGLLTNVEYIFRVSSENKTGVSLPSEQSEPFVIKDNVTEELSPEITTPLEDSFAVENEPAKFYCCFIAVPPPQVTWLRDGIRLRDGIGARIIINESSSALTLEDVDVEDDGSEIQCQLDNSCGKAVSKATLKIMSKPRIANTALYKEGLLFDCGEALRLKMGISGCPFPDVSWYFNGELCPSGNRWDITTTEDCTQLKVLEVGPIDDGVFTLKVTNEHGHDEASIKITVLGAPCPPSGQPECTYLSESSFMLSWNKPKKDGGSPVLGYIIEKKLVSSENWTQIFKTVDNSCQAVFSEVDELEKCCFRVKSFNSFGCSSSSEPSEKVHFIYSSDSCSKIQVAKSYLETLPISIVETIQSSISGISQPSVVEIGQPSVAEIGQPSVVEIDQPSVVEIDQPSVVEIDQPSVVEIDQPSVVEIDQPSVVEIDQPSVVEIDQPSAVEIDQPSVVEISQPSASGISQSSIVGISSQTIATISPSSIAEITQSYLSRITQPSIIEIFVENPETMTKATNSNKSLCLRERDFSTGRFLKNSTTNPIDYFDCGKVDYHDAHQLDNQIYATPEHHYVICSDMNNYILQAEINALSMLEEQCSILPVHFPDYVARVSLLVCTVRHMNIQMPVVLERENDIDSSILVLNGSNHLSITEANAPLVSFTVFVLDSYCNFENTFCSENPSITKSINNGTLEFVIPNRGALTVEQRFPIEQFETRNFSLYSDVNTKISPVRSFHEMLTNRGGDETFSVSQIKPHQSVLPFNNESDTKETENYFEDFFYDYEWNFQEDQDVNLKYPNLEDLFALHENGCIDNSDNHPLEDDLVGQELYLTTEPIPDWLRQVSPNYVFAVGESNVDDQFRNRSSSLSESDLQLREKSVEELLHLADEAQKNFNRKADQIEALENILSQELDALKRDIDLVNVIQRTISESSSDNECPTDDEHDEDLIDFTSDSIVTTNVCSEVTGFAPQVTSHLQNRVVPVGNRIRLACFISANPDPEISWMKNGNALSYKRRYAYSTMWDYGLCSLDIYNSKSSDSGEFTCLATNCYGSTSTQCYLQVIGEKEPSPMAPKFETSPDDASCKKESSVTLDWLVSGIPFPKVIWYKNAEKLQSSLNTDILVNHRGLCRLVLHKIQADDSAIYTCLLENDSGSALSTVFLCVSGD